MPTPEEWLAIARRTEWRVLLSSSLALLAVCALTALVNSVILRRMRVARVVLIALAYVFGGAGYLALFARLYIRAYVRLYETIPSFHGVASNDTATMMAKSQVAGLWDLPPAVEFVAYPTWLVFALPALACLVHITWDLAKHRAV